MLLINDETDGKLKVNVQVMKGKSLLLVYNNSETGSEFKTSELILEMNNIIISQKLHGE